MIFEDLMNARDKFIHPENVLGCDPIEYLESIKTDIEKFVLPLAESLDSIAVGTGATKIAGGGLGVIGGALTIAGIATAPFTFGTSIILAGFGVGVGVAGAVASAGATVTKIVMDKKKQEESRKAFEKIIEKLQKFEELAKNYNTTLMKAQNYLNAETNGNTAEKREFIGKVALNVAKATQAGTVKIATGAVKVGGRVLATSGSKVAVIFGAAGAALGIGFGIWDIVSGAKDIHAVRTSTERTDKTNGDDGKKGDNSKMDEYPLLSEQEKEKEIRDQAKQIADRIRQQAKEMEKNVDDMLQAYQYELNEIKGNEASIE